MESRTVSIIGLGPLGHTLAKAIKELNFADTIIGFDSSIDDLDSLDYIDKGLEKIDASIYKSKVVIVSAPYNHRRREPLSDILDKIAENTIVLGVGPVKDLILESVRKHKNRGQLIACHPMIGNIKPGEAIKTFEEKYLVFYEKDKSNKKIIEKIKPIFTKLRMKIIEEMQVSIIGLGLIGGSMGIEIQESGFAEKVVGYDKDEDHIRQARRRYIIDEEVGVEESYESEFIIVAIPVDSMASQLPKILDKVKENQVVIDVGSTKKKILDNIENHPNRAQFVATHPMAGTEYSGPKAAMHGLFKGKFAAIVDKDKSSPNAVEFVRAFYNSLGMEVIDDLDRNSHDMHTGYISHISHISSFALALTVLEKESEDERRIFELASSGFSSTVRLAKSSRNTWIPIFRQNKDYVVDILESYIDKITEMRELLKRGEREDFEILGDLIEKANRIEILLDKNGNYKRKRIR